MVVTRGGRDIESDLEGAEVDPTAGVDAEVVGAVGEETVVSDGGAADGGNDAGEPVADDGASSTADFDPANNRRDGRAVATRSAIVCFGLKEDRERAGLVERRFLL